MILDTRNSRSALKVQKPELPDAGDSASPRLGSPLGLTKPSWLPARVELPSFPARSFPWIVTEGTVCTCVQEYIFPCTLRANSGCGMEEKAIIHTWVPRRSYVALDIFGHLKSLSLHQGTESRAKRSMYLIQTRGLRMESSLDQVKGTPYQHMLLVPFYIWGTGGLEQWNNLPKLQRNLDCRKPYLPIQHLLGRRSESWYLGITA